jgi:acetyl esterase/lipase
MARMPDFPKAPRRSQLPLSIAALVLLGAPACHVTDLRVWDPAEPRPGNAVKVEEIRGVSYCSGSDSDAFRHSLDLFLPRGQKDYPVVLLVHGGAWIFGDNRCCGLYSSVGQFLASRGIGAVLPNYRLSPGVKHPEQIKDVARAFAWTHAHIAEYGGRPDQLFLVGHSAGGHLVSLLATDEKYLAAEGLRTEDIKGVISVCGVYRIPPGDLHVTLGGTSPEAFRWDELLPVRSQGGRSWAYAAGLPGIPFDSNLFGKVFGDDPQVREDASPLNHVRPGLPPFLLCSASNDLPTLTGPAEEFHRALLDHGCESYRFVVQERNHSSIMFRAVGGDDVMARTMLEFIGAYSTLAPK